MPDRGHHLRFGSFITPTHRDAAATVALAVLSEESGLDVVTFQDHPYQPGFLDTWTLLSFVAARTRRVTVAANVTNLPLRPPAVLARSVASLDLLSSGRVELGIGAGGFWDAIASMGGRRLSAGDSVLALEEAIDVIRALWDVDNPARARVAGRFYGIDGAKRGPAPAHKVSIWVGAYRPRMLALTGRRADGWLPSMAYLKPGDLTRGNTVIDEAAREAGRSPDEVRRLLNIVGTFSDRGTGPLHGPAPQWAEELAELALTEGISTFILASDDPDDLRRFAAEVAPAVRELVTTERESPSVSDHRAGDPSRHDPAPAGGPTAAPEVGTSFPIRPTPDTGVRRSSVRVWDESTRPHSPAPDPGRSYTESDLALSRHLVDIHDVLRAELDQIVELADQVSSGLVDVGAARSSINAMTIRQNNWALGAYSQSYCRTVTMHHTAEDRSMFPLLLRSAPEVAPVVTRLHDEHLTLHGVLQGVDDALVALVSAEASGAAMARFRDAVDLLSDTLLSHLAYEERELLEPLARSGVSI